MEVHLAVGDVYEVTDVQTLYEQEVLNVYFYQQQAAFVPLSGTTAQALADEWVETILPVIAAVQNTDLTHVEVRVRNLFDDTDQGVAVAGVAGQYAGTNGLSTFAAAGLTLNTDNAAVRPGSKRIAGLVEEQQSDGVIVESTAIGLLDDIAEALAAPITGGLIITDDIMFPIVVKRVRSGSPGAYEYRLPENSGELVFGLVIEALVKLIVTSQVSRKIGIGV